MSSSRRLRSSGPPTTSLPSGSGPPPSSKRAKANKEEMVAPVGWLDVISHAELFNLAAPFLLPHNLAAIGSCAKDLAAPMEDAAKIGFALAFPGVMLIDDKLRVAFEWHSRRMFKLYCTHFALTTSDKSSIADTFGKRPSLEKAFAEDPAFFYKHFVPYLKLDRSSSDADDDYSILGQSRAMGLPDFPIDLPWPTCTQAEKGWDSSDENVEWGADHIKELGVTAPLEERLRVCPIAEDKYPLIFISQINLSDARRGYAPRSNDEYVWPFPSTGILYFFLL